MPDLRVQNDGTVFHDEPHAGHCENVVKWITINCDDIRIECGLKLTDCIFPIQLFLPNAQKGKISCSILKKWTLALHFRTFW